MIQTLDLRGRELRPVDLLDLVPRAEADVDSVLASVAELVEAVGAHGETALQEQARRFDGVAPESIRVPVREIRDAVDRLDPAVRAALEAQIERVSAATAAQVPAETTTRLADGATIVQRWHPVARAGLYVPGGKAVYPSSVVMNVVPGQVAGVESIAIASPPQRDHGGSVHPTILGAAGLLGIDEVYAMGGAGAIAALARGVPGLGLEPVQTITGPGNVYVAAAKRLVQGRVGIDAEAGPTEILVIADADAEPRYVAADLISQAEHDENAASVLVTDSEELVDRVIVQLQAQAAGTRHAERVATALGGRQSAIVLVDDLTVAAAVANAYAPEHLEIQVVDTDAVLAEIHDAGVVFVGPTSPVSLGDYLAGSNHVLPTGGAARHSAGLGAYSFLRPQQIVRYDASALEAVADHIGALSSAEDLPAHGDAVRVRTRARGSGAEQR